MKKIYKILKVHNEKELYEKIKTILSKEDFTNSITDLI